MRSDTTGKNHTIERVVGRRVLMGRRLGELRVARRMTLRQAARASGLSPSFISMVERGETEIAISRLIRLCDAYRVVVAELLADMHGPFVEYMALDDALQVPDAEAGVDLRYLCSPSWHMAPFRIGLEPGARLEGLKHPVEEFVHCVAGTPTMIVGGVEWLLRPGDTLVIPPHVGHGYANMASGPALLVGAVERNAVT